MRIIAVFPHPDDELGCVGTLKKHAERGDEVKILWTTKGELASQFGNQENEKVQAERIRHGKYVAKTIGASFEFLNMRDSYMTGSRDEALQIAKVYAAFKPDAVITWSDDHPHPDHRMTAKVAFDAVTLARIPKVLNEDGNTLEAHRKPIRFYQYYSEAINRPVISVDISKQLDTVKELFNFYQSFYGWRYGEEDFMARRRVRAFFSETVYVEKFQIKTNYAPTVDYLP